MALQVLFIYDAVLSYPWVTFQGVLLMPKAIDDIKAYKYYEVF